MKYRQFGRLDWQVSALGFGGMRFPTTKDRQIEEDKAFAMLHAAIDLGVNYIDTAYGYHGGRSEVVIGKAMKGGYREKVKIATKLPPWHVKKPEDFERLLDEQLSRLQMDYIDFYLFHAMDKNAWHDVVLRHNLIPRAERALRDGKIRHIGFSFHDDYDVFEEILAGYDKWEFCQIQYNYMNIHDQAGMRGLKKAASMGLGVVIMEPLLGGRLAVPPPDVAALFASAEPRRTPAEWSLQWLWNQPEVSVVLSGMNTMEQVLENAASASRSQPGMFGEAEEKLIGEVVEQYKGRAPIPCTACRYCMPCPNGVDIPENFHMYNDALIYDQVNAARYAYNNFLPENVRASKCVQCRACEEKCPQKIIISEWMPKVDGKLKNT